MAFPAQQIGPYRQPSEPSVQAPVGHDIMVNGPTSGAMHQALAKQGGSTLTQQDINLMKDRVTAGVKAGQSKDEIMRGVPFELREVAAAEIAQQQDPQKFNLFASAGADNASSQNASFSQAVSGIGGLVKLAVLDMDKQSGASPKAPASTPAEAALAAQQRKGAGEAMSV